MESDSRRKSINFLNELKRDINRKRDFGVDCAEEKEEAAKIENSLIDEQFSKLNDEFIKMHKWKKIHACTVQKWNIVIYNQNVCRVKDIRRTFYDEVSDTFSYQLSLESIFMKEEFIWDFSYYDQIEMLVEIE